MQKRNDRILKLNLNYLGQSQIFKWRIWAKDANCYRISARIGDNTKLLYPQMNQLMKEEPSEAFGAVSPAAPALNFALAAAVAFNNKGNSGEMNIAALLTIRLLISQNICYYYLLFWFRVN